MNHLKEHTHGSCVNSSNHRNDDIILAGLRGRMNQEELKKDETVMSDAELAWMIHEQDSAYSQHGNTGSEAMMGEFSMEGRAVGTRGYDRDDAYIQEDPNKGGSSDRVVHTWSDISDNQTTGLELHDPGMRYPPDSSWRKDAMNASKVKGVLSRGATNFQHDWSSDMASGKNTEESDAEMAKRIHERDYAYAMRNNGQEKMVSSVRGDAENAEVVEKSRKGDVAHSMMTDMDARLARAIDQRERDYMKKVEIDGMIAQQMQSIGMANNKRPRDFELARGNQMEQDSEETSLSPYACVEDDNSASLMNELEGKVPCQYCHTLFSFTMIMEHQVLIYPS